MPQYLFTNNALTTIATGINNSVTTIVLAAGTGAEFPALSAGQVFEGQLINGSTVEIVQVTARSTDTLTVVRAQGGTTAAAFPIGSVFQGILTSEALNSFQPVSAASWSNVTGSRALGSSYTNNTGRWLKVAVTTTVSSVGPLAAVVAGVTILQVGEASGAAVSGIYFDVPPGATYEVTAGGTQTLSTWFEM